MVPSTSGRIAGLTVLKPASDASQLFSASSTVARLAAILPASIITPQSVSSTAGTKSGLCWTAISRAVRIRLSASASWAASALSSRAARATA
jgi:hypothetical protein